MNKPVFLRTVMAALGLAVSVGLSTAVADDTLAFGRLEVVDVAARRVQVGGELYALSSTVVIESSSGTRMDLRSLVDPRTVMLGATAEMKLAAGNDGLPVIIRMVLHPD